jgi:hypothetical protein
MGRAGWPAFRVVALVCAATVCYFIGMGRYPAEDGCHAERRHRGAHHRITLMQRAGQETRDLRNQQPAGGQTGAVAAVTAGYDIGYGAPRAGLGPVAGRAGYPAMFLAAALVTFCGAALALRIGDSSQRRETP